MPVPSSIDQKGTQSISSGTGVYTWTPASADFLHWCLSWHTTPWAWSCYFTHLLQELVSTKINNQNLGKDVQNKVTRQCCCTEKKQPQTLLCFYISPVAGDVTHGHYLSLVTVEHPGTDPGSSPTASEIVYGSIWRENPQSLRQVSLVPLTLSLHCASLNSHLFYGQVPELW